MNQNYPAESRRFQRYEILDYALVYTEREEEGFRSVIVDIGLGGLQLRSRNQMEVGSKVSLTIGNLESLALQIPGEVRYCAPVRDSELYATGILFSPESHEEKAMLAEYVHAVFERQTDQLVDDDETPNSSD